MEKLIVTTRTERGSRPARALRDAGRVPGVLYGHGKETITITMSRHDIEVALLHGERVLEIDLEGSADNVMIKDLQWDTFGQHILHVDFTRVNLDERVDVTVPIVLRGTPVGVEQEDGVLQQVATEVNIECTVRHIPDDIQAMVTELKLGDSLLMKDLALPEGATLVDDEETMVCNVIMVAEEVEEPAEEDEEGAQPEVIGERADEEGEAGDQPAQEG